MSQVPKIYHIPIREPMFINGVMSLAWIKFFETLTQTANISTKADPIALAQKQKEIAFGAVVGVVALQTALTMADGGTLPQLSVGAVGVDDLPVVQVGQMDGFCGLPMVAVNLEF